jgi:hypothetical protein
MVTTRSNPFLPGAKGFTQIRDAVRQTAAIESVLKEATVKQADKHDDHAPKQPAEKQEERPDEKPGIVQPMIDELRFPKDAPTTPKAPPRAPAHPPKPAEQDQDPGGGYNPDHTIPQP